MGNIKVDIVPKNFLGKSSIILGLAFIILMYLKLMFVIDIMAFIIAALGLAGFVCSLISISQYKDRALLNIIPIVVGSLIIFWMLGGLSW